jgi:ABC-type nickel/cobalt efflux system permease component RcnA
MNLQLIQLSILPAVSARDMLMNFVCNLRRLKVAESLVIAAWDEDMYKWAFQMGLPVFYYQPDVAVDLGRDLAYVIQPPPPQHTHTHTHTNKHTHTHTHTHKQTNKQTHIHTHIHDLVAHLCLPACLPAISTAHAHPLRYGSQEFRKVTKLKSQVALEILKMG